MTQVQRFRVAVYGVLVENGKVLLTETKVPSGLIINFPGGGLELGEGPAEAVAREFQEETGLGVEVRDILYSCRSFHQNSEYPTEQLIHLYFAVAVRSGEVRPAGNGDDVNRVFWAERGELNGMAIMPIDREFIHTTAFSALLEGQKSP